jgi:predicted CXXCH cytochrome family protein
MHSSRLLVWQLAPLLLIPAPFQAAEDKPAGPVSFYKHVRPIVQGKCHGCHQPAKAKGDYVMTTYEKLVRGGEDGAAVVPKDAAGSNLLKRITLPLGHEDLMPPKDGPLTAGEIDTIQRWIAEGAVNDTPENAVAKFDASRPPIYTRPPVINSLDYSPDGSLLAVAGFHEVLLHKADGSGLVARLIGLSDRITSVRFSPDGKRLAATGGLPARMAEVQIWNLEDNKPTIPCTALVGRPMANFWDLAAPIPNPSAPLIPNPADKNFLWPAMTIGSSTPCFPPREITSSPWAAT